MPFFTTSDKASLYYSDRGQGFPILALSGLSRNSTDFDYVAPHLSANRLICLDYRGRGKSDWTGAETYTIPTEAGDVIALLDHLGLENVGILGTSRGGLIAMALAMMAKDRLAGVCLVDIGPELAADGMAKIRDYIGKNPVQKTYAEAAEMRAGLLPGFEDVPQSRWDTEVRKHYIETSDGLAINYDPALREVILASASADLPDLWPMFDALAGLPLALVRGANSDLLSLATADEMARRRPDMLRTDVPNRGHVPFLDEPEALAVIQDWTNLL